jgi:class 3 adenylate cyclase/pimeloyl-ACP methyl ester carboxylesterase
VRQIKFATTTDGVQIAYGVEGDGPVVVMTPLLIFESFVYEELSPAYRQFSLLLARHCRLVQYDCRGIGPSGGSDDTPTLENVALDLEAVVRAIDAGPVTLFGRGIGSIPAAQLAATHPELVERLALYSPFLTKEAFPGAEEMTAIAQMCRGNWEMATRMLADVSSRPEFGDDALDNATWYARSTTSETAARMFETMAAAEVDSTGTMSSIRCPTTVFQPMDDPRWIPEVGQGVAATIPGTSLVPLEGGLHSYALGDPIPLVEQILSFVGIDATAVVDPAGNEIHAILFSDIVGHTEMMTRLGDEAGRALIRDHDRITRKQIQAHRGSEVKTLGDGFMASFTTASAAVDCAIWIQRALAQRPGEPISVRIGINAGEPIEEEGDLFGATVILASRISAAAHGGQILVTDTVRGLCAGKQMTFADRGEFQPKGFDTTVRMSEVIWDDGSEARTRTSTP